MKNNFIIFALCLFTSFSYGQSDEDSEESSKRFNYLETKHELGVDIRPLFEGSSPSSLFYRKNYIGREGKTMGFRLGATFMNTFNNSDIEFQGNSFENYRTSSFALSIGLERQKFISDKFIAYGGMDVSGALNQIRYNRQSGTISGSNSTSASENAFGIGLGNFWGMKYHFNSRLSFSAETGFDLFYLSSSVKYSGNVGTISSEKGPVLWDFNYIPLKALRISYHF
ncbi:hypothetical protein MM239_10840 [Belliella sp. DSM 111904]|uniref:Outer membrane protein beta-barrel domain-containing protein n=1 Tax=Belliella filtrata TaxID=2923435 RepID=A0ABS9V0G8_9BACT|nr:hypothetical protein [Belliella filtrata]MCH7409892.1 hypothetical protein [Belliella filtrata]